MYKSKKDNQLKSARDSGTLFSRLFISCQWRRRDLENFFAHENQSLPPSLSENGDLSPVKNISGITDYILKLEDDDTYIFNSVTEIPIIYKPIHRFALHRFALLYNMDLRHERVNIC